MMPTSADPSSVQYSSMIPQLATHMSTLQLGTAGSVSVYCYIHFLFFYLLNLLYNNLPLIISLN